MLSWIFTVLDKRGTPDGYIVMKVPYIVNLTGISRGITETKIYQNN